MSLSEDDFVDRLNHGLHDHAKKNPLVDTITAAFGQILSSVSPKQNSPNPPVLKSVKLRAAFPFGFGHSTRYCGPRCVLIGDAAHRVHPLAGQGVNLGFGDVDKLVQVLEGKLFSFYLISPHFTEFVSKNTSIPKYRWTMSTVCRGRPEAQFEGR